MANRVMTWIEADNQGTKLLWTDISGTTGPWAPAMGTFPVATTISPLVSTTGGSVAGSTAQPATASETYVFSSSGQNWDAFPEASPAANPLTRTVAMIPHIWQSGNSFQPVTIPQDAMNTISILPTALMGITSAANTLDRVRFAHTSAATLGQGVLTVELHQWNAVGAFTPVKTPTSDGQDGIWTASAGQQGFNAQTTLYDRWRNNWDSTTLITAQAASSGNGILSADVTNHNAKGAVFYINTTAAAAVNADLFGMQLRVDAKDPVTASYVPFALFQGNTSVGISVAQVYPGAQLISTSRPLAGSTIMYPSNVVGVLPMALPRTFRVAMISPGGGSSMAGTISMSLIV